MTRSLQHELEVVLGERVQRLVPLAGGDINDAYRGELAGGERLFIKTRSHAPQGMYAREAEGLRWLAEARAVRLPEVRAVSDGLLVLEWIASAGRASHFEELLGHGLAALHRTPAPRFGFERDNYIGPLSQPNAPRDDWPTFYAEQRLMPMLSRATSQGLADGRLRKRFDALFARLPDLAGPAEPPSRLHGDLWSGNVMSDEAGAPALVDPAVYGGHREIDLAMLQLFGAPTQRFFAAYDESYPRAAGHEERVTLYQLYPLLVHLCLFGAGYRGQLERALEEALRAA